MLLGATWRRQAVQLTRKNMTLQWRMRRSLVCELLTPVIIMCVLGLVDRETRSSSDDLDPQPFLHLHQGVQAPISCLVFDSEKGRYGLGFAIPRAWCVPIVFAPAASDEVVQVMQRLQQRHGYDRTSIFNATEQPTAETNAPEACGGTTRCVLGFDTVPLLRSWLAAHPGRAAIALVFGDSHAIPMPDGTLITGQQIGEGAAPLPADLQYEVWYNTTVLNQGWLVRAGDDPLGAWARADGRVPTPGSSGRLESAYLLRPQYQLEDTLVAHRADQAAGVDIAAALAAADGDEDSGDGDVSGGGGDDGAAALELKLKAYPMVRDDEATTISQRFGALFVLCSLGFSSVIMTARVVADKERHVAGALRLAGVAPSAYWLSYWVQAVLTAAAVSGLVLACGGAFHLPLFAHADGGVLFVTFLSFMLAMAAVSFFVAACTHSVLVGAVASIGYLLAGAALGVMSHSPATSSLSYIWWEPDISGAVPTLLGLFVPALHCLKVLADATVATTPASSLNATTGKLVWSEAGSFGWHEVHHMRQNRTTSSMTYDPIDDDPSEVRFVTPPPIDSLEMILASLALYAALTWYLDQLLTGDDAAPQPAHFCLLPSYWWRGATARHDRRVLAQLRARLAASVGAVAGGKSPAEGTADAGGGDGVQTDLDPDDAHEVDPDVAAEERRVCSGEAEGAAVELLLLEKAYVPRLALCIGSLVRRVQNRGKAGAGAGGGGGAAAAQPAATRAVKGVTFSIGTGEVFALLGHNGAGKTTTIKMLTTQVAPTGGDAVVHGISVRSDPDAVRALLGVCPQHDILYGELTAHEHMRLFANLRPPLATNSGSGTKAVEPEGDTKGSDEEADESGGKRAGRQGSATGGLATDVDARIAELLEGVKLAPVAHRQAHTYSGGMKRRLSVALAFVGEPAIAVLDEPTTGMDPASRREVWRLLRAATAGRALLLATHSMEEADGLGDQVGIMSSGRLGALGSPLRLKHRFGLGYTLRLVASAEPAGGAAAIAARVKQLAPAAALEGSHADGRDLSYALAGDAALASAPALLGFVEGVAAGREAGMSLVDWGLAHTSLEEVFLRLAEVDLERQRTQRALGQRRATEARKEARKGVRKSKRREHRRLEVRVRRREGERMGFFVNPANEVVEIDEGGMAEEDGLLVLGDVVVAVDGRACTKRKTVGQVIAGIETPLPHTYTFTVTRAIEEKVEMEKEMEMEMEMEKKEVAETPQQAEQTDEEAALGKGKGRLTSDLSSTNGDGKEVDVLSTDDAPLPTKPTTGVGVAATSISLKARRWLQRSGACNSACNQIYALACRAVLLRLRQGVRVQLSARLEVRVPFALLLVLTPCVCMLIVSRFQSAFVETGTSTLSRYLEMGARAGRYGCSNTTSMLTEMCTRRTGDAATETYESCSFCAQEMGFSCVVIRTSDLDFLAGAVGDQCTSTNAGNDNAHLDFNRMCVVGTAPEHDYQREDFLPAWCNCSSPAFDELVEGSWYCQLNNLMGGILLQDPPATKVVGPDVTTGGLWITFDVWNNGGAAYQLADRWSDYLGWRVPLVVPDPLQAALVGGGLATANETAAAAAGNGFLGMFDAPSETLPSLRASLEESVAAEGLLLNGVLPNGVSSVTPDASAGWGGGARETRTARADVAQLGCCVQLQRRVDDERDCRVPTMFPLPQAAVGPCGCHQEDGLPVSRTLCTDCASLLSMTSQTDATVTNGCACASDSGSGGADEVGSGSGGSDDEPASNCLCAMGDGRIELADDGSLRFNASNPPVYGETKRFSRGFPFSCSEDRTVLYDLVGTSESHAVASTCWDEDCWYSMCVGEGDAVANRRCDGVRLGMQQRCNETHAELDAACAAGATWHHPLDALELRYLWALHQGFNLPSPYPGAATPQLTPLMSAALDAATARHAANSSEAYEPWQHCAPPFCFEFGGGGGGGGGWSCDNLTEAHALLALLYPCLATRPEGATPAPLLPAYVAHLLPAEGDGASAASDDATQMAAGAYGSLDARGMCEEGLQYMGPVFGGIFAEASPGTLAMPMCATGALGGAPTEACGTCVGGTAPRFAHYSAPVYTRRASMRAVMETVRDNQQALRDEVEGGGAADVPPPVTPLEGTSEGYTLELEQLFPSLTLEVEAIDATAASGTLGAASFWGSSEDWAFVRPPAAWEAAAQEWGVRFETAKFRGGPRAAARLSQAGGLATYSLGWLTNTVLKHALDASLGVTAGFRPMPHPLDLTSFSDDAEKALEEVEETRESYGMYVDVVLPLGTSLALPLLVAAAVAEKEHGLRALMEQMGLRMAWYWLVEWLASSALTIASLLLALAAGHGQGVQLVLRSPVATAQLFCLWSQCLVAMAMLLQCCYSRVSVSYLINATIVVVGVLGCLVLNQFVLTRPTDALPPGAYVLAPVAYYRGVHLLFERTIDLATDAEMRAIFAWLGADIVLYAVLALYLDAVLPRQYGVPRHPLFFLRPLARLAHKGAARRHIIGEGASSTARANGGGGDAVGTGVWLGGEDEDEDVRAAREKIGKRLHDGGGDGGGGGGDAPLVEAYRLRKVYAGGKVAVKDLSLEVAGGECFGLLGPNGAGKTTTIAMYTGLYKPTSGHAAICGLDLQTSMAQVQQRIGVCPQFDALWPLLTVSETLAFYCRLKSTGGRGQTGAAAAAAHARAVSLGHVAGRLVGRLSGGMKRRVSLGVSLVGEPAAVFLDEPTTGLDPHTKRQVWELITAAQARQWCALVLTTHSMEEADALCGRIGIMSGGRLACLGTSLHLKKKFSEGHKLALTVTAGSEPAATAYVAKVLPGAAPLTSGGGGGGGRRCAGALERSRGGTTTALFSVPASASLSSLFRDMEARPDEAAVHDWALRQTSLEEVFLRVISRK